MKLRINESKEVLYNFPFTDSGDVYNKMKEYAKADREMFMVMYLNARNHVIDCELHSVGMVDSALVYPREVFRGALLANACAIICVHNHPSGDVTPSGSDDEITQAIVKVGIVLQVNVLDHIIIGTEGYYSYADEGKIGDMEHEAGHVAEGGKPVDWLVHGARKRTRCLRKNSKMVVWGLALNALLAVAVMKSMAWWLESYSISR